MTSSVSVLSYLTVYTPTVFVLSEADILRITARHEMAAVIAVASNTCNRRSHLDFRTHLNVFRESYLKKFSTHLFPIFWGGGEERETNKMQLNRCLLSNFYLNMFRPSVCPSSGEQDCVLPHMVFCNGCVGFGCVGLGRELCALCESYCSTLVGFSLFTLRSWCTVTRNYNNSFSPTIFRLLFISFTFYGFDNLSTFTYLENRVV